MLALYWPGALCLNVLDTTLKPGAVDAGAWASAVGQAKGCVTIEDLARALGLRLEPLEVRGLRARRVGRSLLYSSLAPSSWQRAFLVREVARYALERCAVTVTAEAIEAAAAPLKQFARVGRASGDSAAASSKRARSSPRLRLELS